MTQCGCLPSLYGSESMFLPRQARRPVCTEMEMKACVGTSLEASASPMQTLGWNPDEEHYIERPYGGGRLGLLVRLPTKV